MRHSYTRQWQTSTRNTQIQQTGATMQMYSWISIKEYFPNLLETWLLPRFFVFRVRDLKGGNLDYTSRVICACCNQILRFFNFGGHFYYSNFSSWSNESALRFFDFALFHGFFQVLSLFVTFPRFFQGFMYPGSWKLEKMEESDFCKVSCTRGHEN